MPAALPYAELKARAELRRVNGLVQSAWRMERNHEINVRKVAPELVWKDQQFYLDHLTPIVTHLIRQGKPSLQIPRSAVTLFHRYCDSEGLTLDEFLKTQ